MSPSESPIHEFLRGYKEAVFEKDVNAFVGLYAKNVRVFDMWGAWQYNGLEAWRAMVTGWFASLGAERAGVEFSDIQEQSGEGLIVAHAFASYKGISAAGEQLRSQDNRLTWVLGREDDAWKVLHEHTSAPIDSETSKVLLKR